MRSSVERREGLLVASWASLAVHGAVAALVASGRPPEVRGVSEGDLSFVELAFTSEAPEAPLPPPEAPAAVEQAPSPPRPSQARLRPSAPRPPAVAAETPAVDAVEAEPPPPAPPVLRPSHLPHLDARSAALAALGRDPIVGLRPPIVGRPAAPTEAELESSLDAYLRAEVRRRDDLAGRPPPSLRPRSDGSYAYRGPAFEAVIDPEGTVHFSDRSGHSYDGWRAGEAGQDARADGLRMRFDPTQRAEARHGNDIWAAERAWFLAETEVLRDRLATEARAREHARVRRAVRVALERILGDPSLGPVARRQQIFRLWEDCADDPSGEAARGVIEAFVREHLPASSPHGYGELELRALNSELPRGRGFEPYRLSSAR